MARCLLLVDRDIGHAIAIQDFLVLGNATVVTHPAQVLVTGAAVNGSKTGEAASTLQRAGGIAARLYARVQRRWQPGRCIDIEVSTAALKAPYSGQSGELMFALMTAVGMCEEFRFGWSESLAHVSFAATGRLGDECGRQECAVKGVAGVRQKIAAALDSGALPPGSFLFYPRENHDEVPPELMAEARERSIRLRPVARLEEALHYLGLRHIPQWWLHVPYRGGQVFRLQDEGVFFGRDSQREEATDLLRQQGGGAPAVSSPRGVACLVHARSGAGKSSFLRAGVLADLIAAGRDEGIETLHTLWQLPSDGPQARAQTEQDLLASIIESWLQRGPTDSDPLGARDLGSGFLPGAELAQIGSLSGLANRLGPVAAGRRLVWTVDSLERILAPEVSRPAQIAFAIFLQQLLAQGVWILAAIRDKHLPSLKAWTDDQRTPVFALLFEGRTIELRPMKRAERESTVVGPAWFVGASFEVRGAEALDQKIKEQVDSDAMLPWLGMAMSDLWDRSVQAAQGEADTDSVVLRFDAFEGLAARVAAAAEVVHAGMPDDNQRSLKQLLFALAEYRAGKESAVNAQLGDGLSLPHSPLASALLRNKVLVESSHADVLELRVATNALFSSWQTARDLLIEFRSARLQASYLRQRARAYFGPAGGALLRGAELDSAIALESEFGLFPDADLLRSYLRRSRRRAQVEWAVLGLSGAVALVGVTLYAVQWIEASRAREIALQEKAALLVSSHVGRGRPDLALAEAAKFIPAGLTGEALIPRLEVALLAAGMADLEWWHSRAGVSAASGENVAPGQPISAMAGDQCRGDVLAISPARTRPWRLVQSARSGSARSAPDYELLLCSTDSSVMHRMRVGARMTDGAFDQSGSVMAALSRDSGTSHVWRLSEYRGTAPLALPLIRHGAAQRMRDMVPRWALSPNGLWLAVATSDSRLEICSLNGELPSCRSERLARTVDSGDAAMAFHPNGKELVAVYSAGEGEMATVMQKWTLSTAMADTPLALNLAWPTKFVPVIALSSDGEWTAMLLGQRELLLLNKGQTWAVRLGVDKDIVSVSFRDTKQMLSVEFGDGETRHWSVRSPYGTTPPLDKAREYKNGAEFVDDMHLRVRNEFDTEPEVWQVLPPQRLTAPGSGGIGAPRFAAWNAASSAARDEPGAQVSATEAPRTARCTAAHSGLAGSASAASADGCLFAVSAATGLVLHSQRGVGPGGAAIPIPLTEAPSNITSLALSPAGDLLAAGSEDGEIRLWRLPPGEDVLAIGGQAPQILTGHRKTVRGLVFDRSGRKLASASDDGTARLWLPGANPSETATLELRGHLGLVRSVSLAPSGDFLASLSNDGNVRVWHLPPPAQILKAARVGDSRNPPR